MFSRWTPRILFLLSLTTLAPALQADGDQPNLTGLFQGLSNSAGTLGAASAEVAAYLCNDKIWIDFALSGEEAEPTGAVTRAQWATRDVLKFSFEDRLKNSGTGLFYQDGNNFVLKLTATQGARHGNSSALYRTYLLQRVNNMAEDDRHPWSVPCGDAAAPQRPAHAKEKR